MPNVLNISIILLFVFAGSLVVHFFQQRKHKVIVKNFLNEIRSLGHAKLSNELALKLLSAPESKPRVVKILEAYETKESCYIILFKHQFGETDAKCLAVVIKLAHHYPPFCIYAPSSDYDTYDKLTKEQFKIVLGNKEIRVVTHKGASNEVYQVIEKTSEIERLINSSKGTGLDIEFSGQYVYIWDYYNDDTNIMEGELQKILLVQDVVIEYLVPKVSHLSSDFEIIKNTFTK